MTAKSSDWRPGPSVCRCCFAEGCYKDISTEYFWMGKREVYQEMLSTTFDVSISYAQSGGPNSNSRLICEPCIARLRDASDFKRQVQECERVFHQHLDPTSSVSELEAVVVEPPGKEVKLERVKVESKLSDDEDFDDHAFVDDDDDDLDDQPLTALATKVPKKESVDLMDLLDNAKPEKRKAAAKPKTPPAKKAKKKESPKPSASKPAPKPVEKKRKGKTGQTDTEKESLKVNGEKRRYQRSARAEARFKTKQNASTILECWSVCPFRWIRNRFKCGYCEANFTECSSLREHVRTCMSQHSIKDIYSKFKEMAIINVDLTESSCRICAQTLTDVNLMRTHISEHGFRIDPNHPDGVLPFCLDKESWSCVICKEKFNNFLKLYEHMNVHYQHYICAICGKGYMTAPRLRKHSEVHISGSFPCKDCGRVFSVRVARDYHKAQAHARAPRYECPHCNMRFDGYYDRMNHLNEAHREKEVAYRCSHCELSFKTSGKRANHIRSVHFPLQRSFQCNYCDWSFKKGYELKRHMIKHTGERNFHCTVCEKSYPRNRALIIHMKTHQHEELKRSQLRNLPDLSDLLPAGSDKV
ncbi:zinc finger protein draculin-like isoform X12 [Pectinophora gossypiella]|uniref:zinc finger protein draculin-like isoform X12 n=1 Tax=Pectinophora gossypiella TaxID=13191 RepID=UPI00214E1C32|nr:zinc finger protein draculin-like isoform X12 [Pectinophora gossypiella]